MHSLEWLVLLFLDLFILSYPMGVLGLRRRSGILECGTDGTLECLECSLGVSQKPSSISVFSGHDARVHTKHGGTHTCLAEHCTSRVWCPTIMVAISTWWSIWEVYLQWRPSAKFVYFAPLGPYLNAFLCMIPPFFGLEMEIHEYFHWCESEIGDTSRPWELLKLKVSRRGQFSSAKKQYIVSLVRNIHLFYRSSASL